MRRDALFAGGELGARLSVAEAELTSEAQAIDAAVLLGTDATELTRWLVEKYTFEAPTLVEAGIYVDEPREARVDVSQDRYRTISDRSRPFYVTGTTFTFHIPFEGNEELLLLRPSSYGSIWPEGTVRDGEIQWSFTSTRPDEDPKAPFQRNLALIRDYASWVAAEVAPYNASLPTRTRALIDARRDRLLADAGRVAELGYPIRRRTDAPATYRVPVVRKAMLRPPPPSTKPAGWKPDPAMALEVYEDVLRVVTGMVEVIERSPAAFSTLDEEALRDHFLVQLNGQYEGGASGETFNRGGKTDILVRVEDRVMFVGECKFWDGPQTLLDAITQVLSYLSWHDTKAAVFLFNRERNLTTVLGKVVATVHSHPGFVSDVPYDSAIGFRFLLRHPDDPEREVTLTVLGFQVPSS
jgi:hypothetical protein